MEELFQREKTYVGVRSSEGKEYVCASDTACNREDVLEEEMNDCCCCEVTPSDAWWR